VNLLKSPLRRSTAILAGAVLGLAGAVALAAPASAHFPSISGTATCVKDGEYVVNWVVTNGYPLDANIKDVVVHTGGAVTGDIAVTDKLVTKSGGAVTGQQVVKADVPKAKIRVALKWTDGVREGAEGVVDRPDVCTPEPTPTPTPTASQSSPPSNPPVVGDAEPIIRMDCDTLTFGLDNPADGDEIKLTLTTSKGETRTLTVKPGEQKVEKFSATPGFVLTVKDVASGESVELPYTQPENCSGGGGGGDEPTLPLTGAAAGSIAGGAALLLGLGAFLFVMARRRKVKFTA
jgi:hypothetical protein